MSDNDVHPSRLQTLASLPILYLVIPYLRSTAQLAGWFEGRKMRGSSAPVVPSEQLADSLSR
jgi:hypothetical protein